MSLTFKIEQIAIILPHGADGRVGKALLQSLGARTWHNDKVVAKGEVFGLSAENAANLSFNYDLSCAIEFEILEYIEGKNWRGSESGISHFGMHVTATALNDWRRFFAEHGIEVAQEVITNSHTNPVIKDSRRYHYVIFNTRPLIGVDLKFIVRLNLDGTPFAGE